MTIDNARNDDNAVSEAGLGPHTGCFAHTLNLASQKAMAVSQVSRLLGKISSVAAYSFMSSKNTIVQISVWISKTNINN